MNIFEHSRPLMEFMLEFRMPVPKTFLIATQPALNAAIINALTQEEPDVQYVQRIIEQIHTWNVDTGSYHTEFFIRKYLEGLFHELTDDPTDLVLLQKVGNILELIRKISLELVLWQLQNDYYRLAKARYPECLAKARTEEGEAVAWVDAFRKLGELLNFNLEAILPEN
jgi:hypothetical protein